MIQKVGGPQTQTERARSDAYDRCAHVNIDKPRGNRNIDDWVAPEEGRRHLSYGTPRLTAPPHREFGAVNRKRAERIYCGETLQLPCRKKTPSQPSTNRERPHSMLGNRAPNTYLLVDQTS